MHVQHKVITARLLDVPAGSAAQCGSGDSALMHRDGIRAWRAGVGLPTGSLPLNASDINRYNKTGARRFHALANQARKGLKSSIQSPSPGECAVADTRGTKLKLPLRASQGGHQFASAQASLPPSRGCLMQGQPERPSVSALHRDAHNRLDLGKSARQMGRAACHAEAAPQIA